MSDDTAPLRKPNVVAPTELEPRPRVDVSSATSTIVSAETPRYASFVSLMLGTMICASTAALLFARASVRGIGASGLSTVIVLVAAIVLGFSAINAWRRAVKSSTNAYNRKVMFRLIVFGLLFVGIAGTIGYFVGQSGQETAEMTADFEQMSKVGDRISKARNSVTSTVPANIEMYKSIEPDVQDFDAVLHRLRGELAIYDSKFPSQHDQTAKSIRNIEIGLQRASMLKEQIKVAKEIEFLTPAAQWEGWQKNMEPLLNAESALDKTK